MMKIYCGCGRIIGMDKGAFNLKKSLGKQVECSVCRNHRISNDIDEMNAVFEGTAEEEY